LQTIKHRNLVIDLGNGLKTNAQLTYPAIGKGPFPGVLLIHGSGANDKNETLGYVHKNGPKPIAPFWHIAQYLSERGFAVLRYDSYTLPSGDLNLEYATQVLDKNHTGFQCIYNDACCRGSRDNW
jgi:dienelactone hydrolase